MGEKLARDTLVLLPTATDDVGNVMGENGLVSKPILETRIYKSGPQISRYLKINTYHL